MADWFSDLVMQVSADVIDSQETKDKLALTDRVSAESLTDLAARGVDELRRQFAADLRAIQGLDGEIEQAEHALLGPEWDAVLAARDRVAKARSPGPAPEPARTERIRRFLHLRTANTEPAISVGSALADLGRAEQAYQDARQAKGIADLDPVRRPATRRLDAITPLTAALRQALAIRVNADIDKELEASYERVFSYSGKAELGDPLALAAQPVDTEAFRRLTYLIDDVGSGTIGVAGPRGSGKSTLLHQFATSMTVNGITSRWGLYIPAPAKYDARDFLLYLFARLCAEVLGPARIDQLEKRLSSASPRSAGRGLVAPGDLAVIAAMALTCWGLVVGLTAAGLHESSARMTDLLIACCCTIVCLISVTALFLLGWRLSLTVTGINTAIRRSSTLSGPVRAILAPLAMLTVTIAVVLLGLLPLGVAPRPAYLAAAGLGVAGVAALASLAYSRPRNIRLLPQEGARPKWFPEPRYDNAAEWYAKVKFQQTFTTGWSGTITVGTAPLPQAQGGLSGSSEVSALAMSIPEIVERIKEFIRAIAVDDGDQWRGTADPAPEPTPVVIAIDEIDKINDPADAQEFFNQIKGLFGDTTAVFLVSISDDAMAAFERRGLPIRDVFDSSLSSVVTLSYLSRAEARKLIGSRLLGVQEPVADLLYVLSGGLARDLVRLIRRAVEARLAGNTGLDALMLKLISGEAEAKRRAVLATAGSIPSCPARKTLLGWAGTHIMPADPASYYASLLGSASKLLTTGCPGGQDSDPDSCPATEIGMLLSWLGTTGQLFTTTVSQDDFLTGQKPAEAKSFERLAEARQDFPLGASYVLPIITAHRTALALPVVPGLLSAGRARSRRRARSAGAGL